MTVKAIEIGSRLELFVDDALIERMDGVEQRLHRPIPREIVLVHDAPWEGNSCGYYTVFRDGDVGRLAGRPVRLRFSMQDADLYSLRFGCAGSLRIQR